MAKSAGTHEIRHLLNDINVSELHATCSICGPRSKVYLHKGYWRCRENMGGRRGNGGGLTHVLSNIDETEKTATCAVCGPVRIYEGKGQRKRVGQKWTCGRRTAKRHVGGRTNHVLSNIDEKAGTATCAKCGPTQLYWRPHHDGTGHWGCIYTRGTAGMLAYKNKPDFVPVKCPFCRVFHRWDRRKGQQCRAHLIEHFGYECDICKKPLTNQLRVDHSHSTGEVRGLLCNHCNAGIGMLQDNEALLRAAADYLRDQEQKTQGVLGYAARVERLKQEHIARHGLKCHKCSKPTEEKKLSLVGGKLEDGASKLVCASCHRESLGAKLYADWVQGIANAA